MTSEWPAEARGIERAGQHLDDVGLDQDALLERLPGGQRLGAASAAALHGVAVRVPRVAVGAAELAADVGIDGPEPHAGGGGDVEHRAHREREEPGAATALVEQRPASRRLDAGAGAEQIELVSCLGRSPAAPPAAVAAAEAAGGADERVRRTRGRRGAWFRERSRAGPGGTVSETARGGRGERKAWRLRGSVPFGTSYPNINRSPVASIGIFGLGRWARPTPLHHTLGQVARYPAPGVAAVPSG